MINTIKMVKHPDVKSVLACINLKIQPADSAMNGLPRNKAITSSALKNAT
jgi:hypothetical protein